MNFLLILILPIIFVLYAVFSKDASGTFSAFVIGVCSGLISLIIVSFFNISSLEISVYLSAHLWRYFLQYFCLHAFFGLIAFFLISFSFSGEALDTSFSALFGIFSTVFASIFLKNLSNPTIIELVLYLCIIIGSILIFEFAFNILVANLTSLPDFAVYIISFSSFMLITLLGSYALTTWYLAGSTIVYNIISLGIFFTGIVLNAIASRL